MRVLSAPGVLLAVMTASCGGPGDDGQGAWGSTPGITTPADDAASTTIAASTSTTMVDGSSSTSSAASTSISTSDGITWDMGTPDFGSVQPLGCGGKIDFMFVISASGTMKEHQEKLIAAFPDFMDAIEDRLPDFDVQIMVANANPKPGWAMDDCSLCQDDCDPQGAPPTCGAQITACDKKIGAAVTYPAGTGATNHRCELAGGRRYITSGEPDVKGAFACLAQVGLGGTACTGEAMTAALQPEINDPADEDACNRGFVRDDALLVVTIIQDTFDDFSLGTVEEWIGALRAAKHGDDDAFAVLVLTTDVDLGYGQLCWPDQYVGTKNRLRQLAEGVEHGFIGSICMEGGYGTFFAEHATHLVDLCDELVPPG